MINLVSKLNSTAALLVILILSPVALAQTQRMRNEDVVKMFKAGVGEEILVGVIKAQSSNFDVSPDALIRLKTAGVPDKVVAAMAAAATGKFNPASAEVKSEIKIPDGTEVRMRLRQPLTSATAQVGDRVEFEVAEDVKASDMVVVQKGTPAFGQVTEAKPKKSFGRSGKLNFTIDYIRVPSGDNFRLRATRERKGDDSFGKAGVVTILAGPFGALVKGKDVEIAAGTEFTIFTDGERVIKMAANSQ